jgi:geranylgeranylglycerol-phosphate geranylgeranyltransferase
MGIRASVSTWSIVPIISMVMERVVITQMYTTFCILGILVASRGLELSIYNIIPVFTITLSIMGIYVINDISDLEIDRISHPRRALPQGKVTVRQALIFGIALMVTGPAIAFILNPIAGLMVGMIIVTGICYSVPPIRLRVYPILPNTMVGVLMMFSFIAGATFRIPLSGKVVFGGLLIWGFFSFQSFFKDMEGVEGDRAGGVKTLPVLFGFERAFKISTVVALSTVIFPILFIILFELRWVFIVAIVLLYFAEGYSIYRYSKTFSMDKEESIEDSTLDRPLRHPWLIRLMASVFCMYIVLILASLL